MSAYRDPRMTPLQSVASSSVTRWAVASSSQLNHGGTWNFPVVYGTGSIGVLESLSNDILCNGNNASPRHEVSRGLCQVEELRHRGSVLEVNQRWGWLWHELLHEACIITREIVSYPDDSGRIGAEL